MILNCFMFLTACKFLFSPEFSAAEISCNNGLINSINVTTELQSDVLLPCYFELSLLGSNKTADIAAVWTYRNITVDNLLEIKLQGVVGSWNMRGGRIETFPKLSESGNFTILLHKVQQADLGLYRCQLYKGINCSIAYQELNLKPVADRFLTWLITGTIGGGILLLGVLFITTCFCVKRRKNSNQDIVYSSLHFPKATSSANQHTVENPINTTVIIYATVNNSITEDKGVSSDSPVYATVKKGKRAEKKNHMEQVL